MDLASPLRTLSPGLDSAVLEVLAATESGMSGSQIARLSRRGTRVGQIPVLDRLVQHGLVLAEPANQGFLYRLNREHVLAGPVLATVRARRELMDRLTPALGELRPAPVHASVFGSFARGEGDAESDIDLLVVVPHDSVLGDDDWIDQLQQLSNRVLRWTGNRLEHVVLPVARLRKLHRAGESVVSSWLEDGRLLHGSALESLLRDTAKGARTRGARR